MIIFDKSMKMIFELSIKFFITETFNMYREYRNDNNSNNKK